MIEILIRTAEALLIRPLEDIRMENAHEFYEALTAMDEREKNVYLDLSRVQFVDSSGIGTLIKSAELYRGGKGSLTIVGLNRSLQAVFKLAGLSQIFAVMETTDLKQAFPEDDLRRFF